MGWITFVLTQAALTSIALGALKRKGAIQVNPSKIENDSARFAIVTMINLGEDVTEYVETLVQSALEEARSKK